MADPNNNQMATAVPRTLDLHGYHKEEAIKRLTLFLELAVVGSQRRQQQQHQRRKQRRRSQAQRSSQEGEFVVVEGHSNESNLLCNREVWVSVITGMGSHSRNGPVLRDAVKMLLEKRGMVYRQSKGCFTINANSGTVLMAPPPPTDSKVVVVENFAGIKTVVTSRGGCGAAALLLQSNVGRPVQSLDPTPRQVHEDDKLVEQVQQVSRDEFRLLAKKQHQEHAQINRALSQSQHDEQERRRRLEREEELALHQAMKKSQLFAEAAPSVSFLIGDETEHRGDEELQQAMSESLRELQRQQKENDVEEQRRCLEQDEELALQQALKKSQLLTEEAPLVASFVDDETEHSEDEELQQAMSESIKELQRQEEEERAKEQTEWERVLAASQHDAYPLMSEEEETRLIQQVICQSLQDVGEIPTVKRLDRVDTDNYDDDEDEQLRHILALSCQET